VNRFASAASGNRVVLWGFIVALTCGPVYLMAQDESANTANSNPTQIVIVPRKSQTVAQQQTDQWDCYDDVCEEINWDPYDAYDALVADGYAVALSREEKMRGLICLAAEGAVTGTIAADLLDNPDYDGDTGAEIGAAIAVASGLVRSAYLTRNDDPEAERIVRRFERTLRKWERKYSACLSRKGYQIPSD